MWICTRHSVLLSRRNTRSRCKEVSRYKHFCTASATSYKGSKYNTTKRSGENKLYFKTNRNLSSDVKLIMQSFLRLDLKEIKKKMKYWGRVLLLIHSFIIFKTTLTDFQIHLSSRDQRQKYDEVGRVVWPIRGDKVNIIIINYCINIGINQQ